MASVKDPRDARDARGLNASKGREQLLHDRLAQMSVRLDHFPHEEHHVDGGGERWRLGARRFDAKEGPVRRIAHETPGGLESPVIPVLARRKRLKALGVLNLSKTALTSQGIQHLVGMKELRELDLSGTKLDNSSIKYLLQLTALRRLKLVDCKISMEKALPLRRKINNLVIYMDPS